MAAQFNVRSPAVKRLMKEAQELNESTEDYYAQPLDDNLFEWHFTVRGPPDSDFQDGYYHGRIILPNEYPMKPPSIILLTPSGRFETNKKICLSISGHHPESWQPSWSIRTALLAIIGFMPTEGLGAIGSLDYKSDERKLLAIKSQSWKCTTCGLIKNLLKDKTDKPVQETDQSKEDLKLAKQICFKQTEASNSSNESTSKESTDSQENQYEQELRQRINTESTGHSLTSNEYQSSSSITAASAATTTTTVENRIENSSTRKSTYLIIIISVALAFLIFRRIFLL